MNLAPVTIASTPGFEVTQKFKLPAIPGLPKLGDKMKQIDEIAAPPAADSLLGKLDLKAVQTFQKFRTERGDEWARHLDKVGATTIWNDFASRYRDQAGKVQGWLGTAMLVGTMATNAAVTGAAKLRYKRPRPYEVDPSIKPAVKLPRSASYPSGHTSGAFAAAHMIAHLAPNLGKEAYELATQVALSRVYAGVHYPTDVVAGAILGVGVAQKAIDTASRKQ